MLNSILPFAFPAPAVDTKISKDIALPEPLPIPEPDITIPGGGTIPGTGSGTTTKPTTGAASGSTELSTNMLAGAMEKAMSFIPSLDFAYSPSSEAKSGASGKSGDAYSQSTFGDFIVGGSKGTSLGTFMIIGGSVIAVILLIKTLARKK